MVEILTLVDEPSGVLSEPPSELSSLISKVKSNIFGIWSRNGNEPVWCGGSLYVRSSFFNHSCFPNCSVIQDSNTKSYAHLYPGGASFTVRCLSNTPRGTELCISYIPLDECTAKRRHILQKNWLFLCNCRRCCDPSSDDKPISKYCCKTPKCVGGILIPTSDATADDDEDDSNNSDGDGHNNRIVGVCRVCFACSYIPIERDLFI